MGLGVGLLGGGGGDGLELFQRNLELYLGSVLSNTALLVSDDEVALL